MEGNPHDQQNPYPQRNQMGALRSRSSAPLAGPVFDAHGREAERMARDLEPVRQADLFGDAEATIAERLADFDLNFPWPCLAHRDA